MSSFDRTHLTIITVTFNAQDLIVDTIKSVSEQTYQDYEHLIIDGASKDETLLQIHQYKTDKTRLISEPDKGLYDAMNKGLRAAKGDYVFFLHAGDVLYQSDTLEKIFLTAAKEDFIYGDVRIVDAEGNLRPYHKQKPKQAELSYKSFIKGMVICHQAIIVKKEKAAQYNFEKYKIAADIDWAIQTLKKCNTFYDVNCIISLFLAGGISQKRRKIALIERLWISIHHFGWWRTLIAQVQIVFDNLGSKKHKSTHHK